LPEKVGIPYAAYSFFIHQIFCHKKYICGSKNLHSSADKILEKEETVPGATHSNHYIMVGVCSGHKTKCQISLPHVLYREGIELASCQQNIFILAFAGIQ
jgi:hypothetical protein